MGVVAVYSWKLVDDATDKAEIIFSGARQYLLAHPDENIDALEAYEKSTQSISETAPLLLKEIEAESQSETKSSVDVEDKSQVTKLVEETVQPVESKAKTPVKVKKEVVQPTENSSENNAQSKTAPKAKTTTTRARRTTQKVEPKAEGADRKRFQWLKISTSAKTVTKKRAPAKAKENLENTAKTSDKSLENTENKAE